MGKGLVKTDKVAIRNRVIELIGPDKAFVLDAYAGAGVMYRAVWNRAARYTACDRKFFFDKRTAYVCNNELLFKVIDLSRFNLFDLDAYGSPWENCLTIAKRRVVSPGERIGIVLTDGSSLKLRFGSAPTAINELTGIGRARSATKKDNTDVAIACMDGLARKMNCRIERRFMALGRGSQPGQPGGLDSRMGYYGLVLVGLEPEAPDVAAAA